MPRSLVIKKLVHGCGDYWDYYIKIIWDYYIKIMTNRDTFVAIPGGLLGLIRDYAG